MEIREASENDLDALLKLRFENAKYHSEFVVHQSLKVGTFDFFKNHTIESLNNKDCKIFIANDSKEICGYIIGFVNRQHPIFDFGNEALIDDFYVMNSHRKKGHGKRLYNSLIKWFNANDIKQVNLNVYQNNSIGDDFWDKENFGTQFHRKSKEIK